MLTLWLLIFIESCCFTNIYAVENTFAHIQNTDGVIPDENTPISLQVPNYVDPTTINEDVPKTSTDQNGVDAQVNTNENENENENGDGNENNNEPTSTTVKIAPLVLQPSMADAIDVPGSKGLLVPLVIPAVPSNLTHLMNNSTEESSEESTENSASISGEIRKREIEDLDVAEDIVFRPLFRYRQEQADRFRSRLGDQRYFQPYIYARRPY